MAETTAGEQPLTGEMAGNNDPGRHCLGLDKSRIRLYTTAWHAVLAMATLAIYAVTPPCSAAHRHPGTPAGTRAGQPRPPARDDPAHRPEPGPAHLSPSSSGHWPG